MDLETKIELVQKGTTLEILTKDELRSLFETNSHPTHYMGFEISGKVHLGTGLCTALKIKDFLSAGIKPIIFLADYHAWINGKLGGDLEKIQSVAQGYFKHAFISLGLSEDKVNYILASEIYDNGYWRDVLHISKSTTLARMLRCTTIMGRTGGKDSMDCASTLYPAMQAADIWKLDVDIAHAGMDQRKVHVLSRELSEKFKRKKAVAVHGRLLTSLTGPGRMDAAGTGAKNEAEASKGDAGPKRVSHSDDDSADAAMIAGKMSKSNPKSCIFIEDSEEEIKEKITSAYCPPRVTDGNPIIEMAEFFILRDKPLKVERPQKFGGDVEFASAGELKSSYAEGKLHPLDLKNAVGTELISILEPSRKYFEKHPKLMFIE